MDSKSGSPLVTPDVPEIGQEVVVEPTTLLEENKWHGVDIYETKPIEGFPDDWSFELQTSTSTDVELNEEIDCWIRNVNEKYETVETSRMDRHIGFDTMRDRYLEAADHLVSDPGRFEVEQLGQAKGMLTRCIKKDQPDWYTVYYLLGKPSHIKMQRGKSAITRLQEAVKNGDGTEATAAIEQLQEYGILQRYRYFIQHVDSGLEYGALKSEELIRRIHQINPDDFEYFVADLLEADGWTAEVTEDPYYEKRGVDVIAEKEGPFSQKIAAQIKRYDPDDGRHGTTVVRSYNNIHEVVDGASISAIISTSTFTSDAEDLAQETAARIVDGEGLTKFIEGIGGYHIVNDYIS